MLTGKSVIPVIVLLTAFGQAGAVADEASHREAVGQLFELTGMQQKIEDSVDSVLALQLSQAAGSRLISTSLLDYLR